MPTRSVLCLAGALTSLALVACSSPTIAETTTNQNVVASAPETTPSSSPSAAASASGDVDDAPRVPGYDVGAFPEIPVIEIPDVSLLTESAPQFSVSLQERFGDLKGVKVGAALCDANGGLTSDSVNSSFYHKDGSRSVTKDGSGAGTVKDGALNIVNNGDGSGTLAYGALHIVLAGDGSGTYDYGSLHVVLDGQGQGTLKDGALAIANNGDGSGTYDFGAEHIVNNGDGSGSYKSGSLSITNDGQGKALITDAAYQAEVPAEPLPKLAPAGKFPTLDALTPDNICGVLITVESEVLFDFGSAEVRPDAAATLGDVATALNEVGAPAAEVIGHTDSIDTDEFNQKLSEDRANAVVAVLKSDGVTATLTATGKGESEPVAPNENEDGSDNPAGRQLNRRVEIFIPSF